MSRHRDTIISMLDMFDANRIFVIYGILYIDFTICTLHIVYFIRINTKIFVFKFRDF